MPYENNKLSELEGKIGGIAGIIGAHTLTTGNKPEMDEKIADELIVVVKYGFGYYLNILHYTEKDLESVYDQLFKESVSQFLEKLESWQKNTGVRIDKIEKDLESIYNVLPKESLSQIRAGLKHYENFTDVMTNIIHKKLRSNPSLAYDIFLRKGGINDRKPIVEKFAKIANIEALAEWSHHYVPAPL